MTIIIQFIPLIYIAYQTNEFNVFFYLTHSHTHGDQTPYLNHPQIDEVIPLELQARGLKNLMLKLFLFYFYYIF